MHFLWNTLGPKLVDSFLQTSFRLCFCRAFHVANLSRNTGLWYTNVGDTDIDKRNQSNFIWCLLQFCNACVCITICRPVELECNFDAVDVAIEYQCKHELSKRLAPSKEVGCYYSSLLPLLSCYSRQMPSLFSEKSLNIS